MTKSYMAHEDSCLHRMKMSAYTMVGATGELAERLEALTGEEAACCVSRLEELEARVDSEGDFDARIDVHRALAEPKRLLVVGLLDRAEELCACEIQTVLDVSHATVSHHMERLAGAGLVEVDRRGRWAYYSLTDEGRRWAP